MMDVIRFWLSMGCDGFHMDFLLHFGSSHYNDLFHCEHPFFSSEGKGDVSAFVDKYKENYEKILVIVNPSAKGASFESGLSSEQVLYSYGKSAHKKDGNWIAPPCSVTLLKL